MIEFVERVKLSIVLYVVFIFFCFLVAQPEAQTGMTPSQISDKYSRGMVFLVIRGTNVDGMEEIKTGSGFIISSQGYVITSAHLLQDKNRVNYVKARVTGSLGVNFDIQTPTGIIWPLEVVRMSSDVDIALLKLPSAPPQSYSTVAMCREDRTKVGERVYALSYPLGHALSINSGHLSNKDGPRGLWKTDILVSEGSSGGAVFNELGQVIGVVRGGIAEAPGNVFIVPTNLILDILQTGLAFLECVGTSDDTGQQSVNWMRSSNGGCLVHNPFPRPQESIIWVGPCKNGYADGQGTLSWYLGNSFESLTIAKFLVGKPEGAAVLIYEDGTRIEATFRNGLIDGRVVQNVDGARTYQIFEAGRFIRYGGLSVCNKTASAVYIAHAFHDAGTYTAQGWVVLQTKECTFLIDHFIDEKMFYLYAESEGGTNWADNKGVSFCINSKDVFSIPKDSKCTGPDLIRRGFRGFQTSAGWLEWAIEPQR